MPLVRLLSSATNRHIISGHANACGLDLQVLRTTTGDNPQHDVLITMFCQPQPFVRVAVFNQALGHVRPGRPGGNSRAVTTARRWLRAQPDPLVALQGAAAELCRPDVPFGDRPSTTVAWVDVLGVAGRLRALSAGRCADAQVAQIRGGRLSQLLRAPASTSQAETEWDLVKDAALPLLSWRRRNVRRRHARTASTDGHSFLNLDLGAAPQPQPELCGQHDLQALSAADAIVVSTDSLGLPDSQDSFDIAAHIEALLDSQPPPGPGQPHSNVAAAVIRPAPAPS